MYTCRFPSLLVLLMLTVPFKVGFGDNLMMFFTILFLNNSVSEKQVSKLCTSAAKADTVTNDAKSRVIIFLFIYK